MGTAVAVGVGLLVLLAIADAIGSKALVFISAAAVVVCALEAFTMLQRAGFRPATVLGLVGTGGVVLAAYWKGLEALPLISVVMLAATIAWYLLRIVDARPLANVAVTTMTFLWIGLLGSYAGLLLRAAHGRGLFVGAILPAVAADIGAYVVGSWIGSRPLAPAVSPGKTVEGFIGGLLAALVIGAIVGRQLDPWGGTRHGLVLGLVVGIAAPFGDLFESMIKRDLSLKDSGTVFPGHGGALDRFDSLLFTLPAAYYVAFWFHILH
jgi:phosphatidate cytidylyltransferase